MSEVRTIKYAVLFNLSVQLQNYTDIALNDIRIVPDEGTDILFNNLGILFKPQNDVYTALVEVHGSGAFSSFTRVMIPDDAVFTFHLTLRNTAFQNSRSNLSAYDLDTNIFEFSNSTHHWESGKSYLTKEIPAYSSADTYSKGYLSKQGGNLYLALQTNGPGNVHDVLQAAYWKQIAAAPYVSQADLRTRIKSDPDPAILIDPVPASASALIKIRNSPAIHSDERLLDRMSMVVDGVTYPMQKPKQPTYYILFKNNTTN